MNPILARLESVDIPKEAYRSSDILRGKKIFRIYLKIVNTKNNEKRVTIGWSDDAHSKTMKPNGNYLKFYPNNCKDVLNPDDIPEDTLRIGLFALVFSIVSRLKIYPKLINIYGFITTHAILDYCIYNILERSSVTSLFTDTMKKQVLFSKKTYSDSWYSDLFNKNIDEKLNHKFRDEWLDLCKERNITNVWLSIDGSNNDCDVVHSDLPAKGQAKSHENTDIISYIDIIDADSGLPIYYFINNGRTVDCKAIEDIIPILNEKGITVLGIIIDRGFCTLSVFNLLKKFNFEFIIMLKSSTFAHKELLNKYIKILPWNISYLLETQDIIFGVNEKIKIFHKQKDEAYVNLFYDPTNSSERRVSFLKNLNKEFKNIKSQIQQSKIPEIPQQFSKFIKIEEKDNNRIVSFDIEKTQRFIDEKGFYCIASSKEYPSSTVFDLYNARDISEKQFSTSKTQLNMEVSRQHCTEGILSKFFIRFLSSIIRCKIKNICKKYEFDTNKIIRELNEVSIVLLPNNLYFFPNKLTNRQKSFYSDFDIDANTFIELTSCINKKILENTCTSVYEFPFASEQKTIKRGRPQKNEISDADNKENINDDSFQPKKKGRPKGSKNKKKIQSTNIQNEINKNSNENNNI